MDIEILSTISIGVFTGILTAVFLVWFKNTFYKIIIPWYLDTIYKGSDVSGEWSGKMKISKQEYDVSLSLKQKAHLVKGNFSATSDDPDARRNVTLMTCEGELWEGYLSLTCRSIDKKDLSFGSILLKIKGKELSGKQVFRDLSRSPNDVFSSNISFHLNQ